MKKLIYTTPQTQLIAVSHDAILAGSVSSDGLSGDTSNPGGEADQGGAHAPGLNLWEEVDIDRGYKEEY